MSINAFTADDYRYMARALRLAERGLYTTSPNPRVGCVLVRDGDVVGEGWHERAGEPHAEVHALRMAGARARGATAYVTLEPCSHYGRTPPCAHAVAEAGVARAVAAMQDPNPLVAGRGFTYLSNAGVETAWGVLEAQAEALNAGFVKRMREGRPLVRVKLGASLDGRTALANGRSQWITSPAARADVQRWRARSCAVLSGVDTVIADDARLNVRDPVFNRQPLRVILDSSLRMPATAALLQTSGVLIAHVSGRPEHRSVLEASGAETWLAPQQDGRVDLPALLRELGRRGLNEILVEAGPTLAGAFVKQGLADEIVLYQAPIVIGSEGRGLFDRIALDDLSDASRWTLIDSRAVGPDRRQHYVRNS